MCMCSLSSTTCWRLFFSHLWEFCPHDLSCKGSTSYHTLGIRFRHMNFRRKANIQSIAIPDHHKPHIYLTLFLKTLITFIEVWFTFSKMYPLSLCKSVIHDEFIPVYNHHPNLDKIDVTPKSFFMAHYIQSFPLPPAQILDIYWSGFSFTVVCLF